jgi:beta-galactosidase
MNRRSFLARSGVTAALFTQAGRLLAASQDQPQKGIIQPASLSVRFSDSQLIVPDEGWQMWPDQKAAWKDDTIYLPDEVHLDQLPTNPPTGGWAILDTTPGIPVTLPSTVEQYFWGLQGYRPYKDEYKFETTDSAVQNGAYYGVSWWWRDISIPQSFCGKRILLHIRGARQRAEVYLNQKLVGYSILEELPFECDLTAAAKPGEKNQLAIRITNPGGRLDWVDGNRIAWGGHEFQKSHGFGGIDRSILLSAHDPVRISDLWALNTPTPKLIRANAIVENSAPTATSGQLRLLIVDPHTGHTLAEKTTPLQVKSNSSEQLEVEISAPEAKIWDLDTPNLYRLRAIWTSSPQQSTSARETDFGFRWIAPEGIGEKALIRLNGRRIRIYTSISWGFWALNGLFPTPELAEKEVRVAKQFNLNTLNFHRNLGKEDVLYVQDRLGLLRCLEPGGGAQAFLPAQQGHESSRKYMRAKITGMIRAFRSHPSVVHYIIQNETTLNPDSPELAELFELMQAEDPSRTIVGNDGFVMRAPQAWAEPYQTQIRHSSGKATESGGAGGWWVDHTGHFSDIWQDTYYNSPTDFFYRSTITGEIVEWGEMKGAAAPDNHAGLLRQIARHGGHSYDKHDHEEILRAYETFLDRWNFRAAFPTSDKLFLSLGRRAYESWGQFMENVRICDENDMAAISGWESTAMENHSGLVDNFRDFKSDPRPLSDSLIPLRPIAKQRNLVLNTGDKATFDLYLLNDTVNPATGDLTLTLHSPGSPDGTVQKITTVPAPTHERDRLSYLLKQDVSTPALNREGSWKVNFTLNADPHAAHETTLLVVDPAPAGLKKLNVGVAELAPPIAKALANLPGISVEEFRPGAHYDVIVASGGSAEASRNLDVDAEGAYKPQTSTPKEQTLSPEVLAAVKSGTPLLAITPTDGQSIGVAKQLAAEGAFQFNGMVGPSRASWMGSWYFVRKHPLYDGLPVDQAMSIHYQVKSGGSNGWLIEGQNVEIVTGYSRDHDRNIGAGTLTAKVGSTPIVLHRITDMHPVFLQRFIANSLNFLSSPPQAS